MCDKIHVVPFHKMLLLQVLRYFGQDTTVVLFRLSDSSLTSFFLSESEEAAHGRSNI